MARQNYRRLSLLFIPISDSVQGFCLSPSIIAYPAGLRHNLPSNRVACRPSVSRESVLVKASARLHCPDIQKIEDTDPVATSKSIADMAPLTERWRESHWVSTVVKRSFGTGNSL